MVRDVSFDRKSLVAETHCAEGIPADRVTNVGNIMLDSLELTLPAIAAADTAGKLGLAGAYGVVTLHRPSNVDAPGQLARLAAALIAVQEPSRAPSSLCIRAPPRASPPPGSTRA